MRRTTYHTGYRARTAAPMIPAGSSIPPIVIPPALGANDGGTVILQPGANGYPYASIQTPTGNFALETSPAPYGIDGGSPSFSLDTSGNPSAYGIGAPVLQSGDASTSFAVPGSSATTPARTRSPKRIAMDAAAAAAATPANSQRYRAKAKPAGWASLSTTTKITIAAGGGVLLLMYFAYRRVTAPARYLHRIGRAVGAVHKAVKGG